MHGTAIYAVVHQVLMYCIQDGKRMCHSVIKFYNIHSVLRPSHFTSEQQSLLTASAFGAMCEP